MQVKGHVISARKVASLLYQLGYSLQSNRKTKEGNSHPDRDTQFQHIHDQVQDFQNRCQPVISVDTKKKRNYWRVQKQWAGMATQKATH